MSGMGVSGRLSGPVARQESAGVQPTSALSGPMQELDGKVGLPSVVGQVGLGTDPVAGLRQRESVSVNRSSLVTQVAERIALAALDGKRMGIDQPEELAFRSSLERYLAPHRPGSGNAPHLADLRLSLASQPAGRVEAMAGQATSFQSK